MLYKASKLYGLTPMTTASLSFSFHCNIDHTHQARMLNDVLKYVNQQNARH